MPNTKSAKKRLKQSEKAKDRNRAVRTRVRNATKEARQALSTGAEGQADVVKTALKELDKGHTKGVYKKETVNRLKSRLAKKLAAGKTAG